MDRAISLEARRIDLAFEPSFKLGQCRVDPAAHEVVWPQGSRRLQPQTAKVLVALHDRMSEVVSRDELVDRCWDGRVVGEDVINRCISLLRKVAAESGGFEIQTVPRGGYRLVEERAAPTAEQDDSPAPPWRWPRRRHEWILASGAAGLLLVGAMTLVFGQSSGRQVNTVVLKPFDVAGNAAPARTLAAGVSAEVSGALSATGVNVIDDGPVKRSGKAAFVLGGRTELTGANLHATAELQDADDQSVVWSASFTRPSAQIEAMQEQVAANVAQVLHCALDTARQPDGEQLNQASIKLYLKACELQQEIDPPSDQIRGLLEQVTSRQPRFVEGWARLAFFTANAAFAASPREQIALRREARAAAQSALRLNPRSAMAHEALTELKLGRVPFAEIYREAQENLSLDQNTDYLAGDGGELLLRMGRLREGLERSRRGVELDPFSPTQASDLITALIDNSRNTEAQATVERALRLWPDDNILRLIRLDYEARFGDPDGALSIISDPERRPVKVRDVTLQAYRRLADARKSSDRAEKQAFISWMEKKVASNQLSADFAAPHMAQFGGVDAAFKIAFAAPADVINIDPEFLWEPESAALRRDPRFIALAAKFNVADFWSAT